MKIGLFDKSDNISASKNRLLILLKLDPLDELSAVEFAKPNGLDFNDTDL